MATKRRRKIHGPKVSGPNVTPQGWVENGWAKCRLPYSEDFVAELKEKIDWRLRSWSPSERVWMVDPSVMGVAEEVALKYFPDFVWLKTSPNAARTSVPEPPAERLEDGTYGTLANLLRVSSSDTLKRLFKNLAVDLHPDRGGDIETMKLLNTAWDRIRLERGIR